jgi:hypothetical protein
MNKFINILKESYYNNEISLRDCNTIIDCIFLGEKYERL